MIKYAVILENDTKVIFPNKRKALDFMDTYTNAEESFQFCSLSKYDDEVPLDFDPETGEIFPGTNEALEDLHL